MSRTLKQAIAGGLHLPRCLRDFHDQKEVFKAIDNTMGMRVPVSGVVDRRSGAPYALDWITAHCYVIDKFLQFMAAHGYTLQRSRLPVNDGYIDLDATLREERDRPYRETKARAVARTGDPEAAPSIHDL
jgi:hypothetical protein